MNFLVYSSTLKFKFIYFNIFNRETLFLKTSEENIKKIFHVNALYFPPGDMFLFSDKDNNFFDICLKFKEKGIQTCEKISRKE